ncbi:MAG: hypothetical protein EOO07_26975, partial [Chitinophagaceae bacterium]
MTQKGAPLNTPETTMKFIVIGAAFVLLALGGGVLYLWNHLTASSYSDKIVEMSYNSAICIILAGIALLALISMQVWLARICALVIFLIGSLIFVESISGFSVEVHYWFMSSLKELPPQPTLMSPSSATCFSLIGLSLLLLSSNLSLPKNRLLVPIVFLNLVAITITAIALLGHGIGLLPAFVWLGIKMAPHTALGVALLSLTIIYYTNHHATEAFNRLNFFKRMIIGFGFMAVLVVAIGSVAFMQLNTVSKIVHELYNNPLQTNNAITHIRMELNDLNRSLKNVAIRPEVSDYQRIPEMLETTDYIIQKNISEIRANDDFFSKDLDRFLAGYTDWKNYVLESYEFLKRNAFESYALRTLYDGQEKITELEIILADIDMHAQERITELN